MCVLSGFVMGFTNLKMVLFFLSYGWPSQFSGIFMLDDHTILPFSYLRLSFLIGAVLSQNPQTKKNIPLWTNP